MSNIYIYEPATNGKVVLETTMGDIEIELWSKEAPKACRNFIALIMEGYYDGLIFHRIVENFIVQTGDPTGTGSGGESFYGEPFEDEPHQRLKFTRRGLVGMANNQARNTNTSQFFITLDQTPELQNKHTIFGKISSEGNTIFNVIKIGQLETDADERPLYPPKIKSVKILDNPFDDIVVRITAAERRRQEARRRESAREREEMAGRKKVKKNTKLLSFGEEAGEDEAEAESAKKNLVRPDLAPSTEPDLLTSFESIPIPPSSSRPAPAAASSSKQPSSKPLKSSKGDDQGDLSAIRKKAIEDEDAPATKRRLEIAALESSLRASKKKRATSPTSSTGSPPPPPKTSALQAELASYSRGRGGSKGKGKAKEEDDILAMLGSFRKKMQSAPTAREDEDGEDGGEVRSDAEGGGELEVDRDEGWMGHRLIEEKDEKAAAETRRAETDYEVIDTRGRAKQALDDKHRSRPPPKKDARSSAQWAGRRR